MMTQNWLLAVDAAINLVLGLLLLVFPAPIVHWLGVPDPHPRFYASLLGAIFVGISIALVIETRRVRPAGLVGLGLGGAVAINLCGGLTLAVWLIRSPLALTFAGQVFLWVLVAILVGISSAELIAHVIHNR